MIDVHVGPTRLQQSHDLSTRPARRQPMVKRRRGQQTRRARARRRCIRPQRRRWLGWLGLCAGWALRNARVESPTRKCAQQRSVCPTLASPSICVDSVCFTPSPALPLVQACVCRACSLCHLSIYLPIPPLSANACPRSHSYPCYIASAQGLIYAGCTYYRANSRYEIAGDHYPLSITVTRPRPPIQHKQAS